MARKRHKEPQAGQPGFIPTNDEQRRAHADAMAKSHAGHQCAQRAAALSEAADYYAVLGEHDLAELHFQEALQIEGAEPGSVHAYYAMFLFGRGRTAEALDLISHARRLDPDHPEVFLTIGEALLEHGHVQQAVRWLTAGIVRLHGSLPGVGLDDLRDDFDLRLLAETRQVARERLGLATDHIDEMVRELQPEPSISS